MNLYYFITFQRILFILKSYSSCLELAINLINATNSPVERSVVLLLSPRSLPLGSTPQFSSSVLLLHSATSPTVWTGRSQRSIGLSSERSSWHSKRCEVVWSSCPHRGQLGTSAAPMLCRYDWSRGLFWARSWASVLLIAHGVLLLEPTKYGHEPRQLTSDVAPSALMPEVRLSSYVKYRPIDS